MNFWGGRGADLMKLCNEILMTGKVLLFFDSGIMPFIQDNQNQSSTENWHPNIMLGTGIIIFLARLLVNRLKAIIPTTMRFKIKLGA